MRDWIEGLFPERHVYLRSGGETRGYILTTGKQVFLAGIASVLGVWLILATASTALTLFKGANGDQEVSQVTAKYERLMADRDARLDSAVAKLSVTAGSVDELARTVEHRHAALIRVLGDFKGVPGAEEALAPEPPLDSKTRSPIERVLAVRMDQERMVGKAEDYAHTRAERLRLAFRLAGLNPGSYTPQTGTPHTGSGQSGSGQSGSGLGGPLVDAQDPKALAAVLDVDEAFASRIQRASADLSDMRALQTEENRLPFGRPASAGDVHQTSGFGVRADPFTGHPALHTGLDFAGPLLTPIHATAPGIVSFTGPRSGYGNVVEIDHGGGFKTRYAHLATIAVHVGDHVALGQRIAGMGSTGRSTGPHVHYEVWINGRVVNPIGFVKAGDYVQQN
ncbi:MAG TPA: peptidoglycan DD-metalloendopeptidase family protein [Caulobacteraceae bacterium]|jgi:murein DD-endopeptidase MepM/ murein hydrolase activator NlpD|nr:peptidoglycan DD-metalloendopeptidase family protein [Caulobacteraceae bacterium]